MSALSAELRNLFDNTKSFSRDEWAAFLGVQQSTIEDWLSDAAIPAPTDLRRIESGIETISDIKPIPLDTLSKMKEQRLNEASPLVPTSFGTNVNQTLGEYMNTTAFPGAGLDNLPTIGINIKPDSSLTDSDNSAVDLRNDCLRIANSIPGITTIRIDSNTQQLIACGSEDAIKELEAKSKASGRSFTNNVLCLPDSPDE